MPSGIVSDGCSRARTACRPAIRAEVAAEYRERLEAAGGLQRWWLAWCVEREVRRRVAAAAPEHACY